MHCLAIFAHEKLSCVVTDQSSEGSAIRLYVDANGCKIVPVFPHSCLYAGDLTASIRTGVMILQVQMENVGCQGSLALLYNPKNAPSFSSGCWNSEINPELAFTVGPTYLREVF